MDLEEKFKKATGFDAYADNDLRPKVPSDYYVEWLEEKINFTRCCDKLKDKQAISFGRYCATRGYHKFEGVWVNRQKFPRDLEWIKKQYNKDVFDL